MNEQHRTNLLTACAFAKVFIEAAEVEMRGGHSDYRVDSSLDLAAALRNLDPPKDVPVIDWPQIVEDTNGQ